MTRVLILCTHNSARSQMAEGWVRHYVAEAGLNVEVVSAGTQKTRVKPEAVAVMLEVGIDLGGHRSKTLDEVADPLHFGVVLTVCDSANEAYPARTTRLHASFPDPSGRDVTVWRDVRDALGRMSRVLVAHLVEGQPFAENWLEKRTGATPPVAGNF